MYLRPGTRIELHGTPAMGSFSEVKPEQAKIGQWRKSVSGERMPGWHIVRFNDGGALCVHESRFRVIDNRPAA